MMRPRLRAYLGLGLLAAGLCGLALAGDLAVHVERFVAFYGLSLGGFALLAAASLPRAGINPYRYAPDDPRLDGVDYADRARVNHPRVRTVYPPPSRQRRRRRSCRHC
jgi:hypothetical protein